MYYVYLLYSPSKDRFYVGFSADTDARLAAHNAERSASTKSGAPWRLVYFEAYEHKTDAMRRERKLKHHARGLIELKKRITITERNGEGAVPRRNY
jgi:putative endonuclease